MTDWRDLLAATSQVPEPTMYLETFHLKLDTASQPVRGECSDGHIYYLKGILERWDGSIDRTPFNEQVIARLGQMIDAPIPPIAIVEIPAVLWRAEQRLQHFRPGPTHASRFMPDCTDRMWGHYFQEPANRPRFAALCTLYTWMRGSDHQVIHEIAPPHRVWSVDHGHFFVGQPQWSPMELATIPPVDQFDPMFAYAGLTSSELTEPIMRLAGITDEDIAAVVAGPPAAWSVPIEDRIALCQFIASRRDQVVALRLAP